MRPTIESVQLLIRGAENREGKGSKFTTNKLRGIRIFYLAVQTNTVHCKLSYIYMYIYISAESGSDGRTIGGIVFECFYYCNLPSMILLT